MPRLSGPPRRELLEMFDFLLKRRSDPCVLRHLGSREVLGLPGLSLGGDSRSLDRSHDADEQTGLDPAQPCRRCTTYVLIGSGLSWSGCTIGHLSA